jgi:replicative DNA helicase
VGTVDEMQSTIYNFIESREVKERNVSVVITIDHIILTKGNQNEQEKSILDNLYRMLNRLKKQFASEGIKVLFVALSQLNRDIESAERRNPKYHYPTRNDIFGASSVYNGSDYVMISHNPSTIDGIESYGTRQLPIKCDKTNRAFIYWHLIKNRFGRTSIMKMRENFENSSIDDYNEHE